RKREADPRRRRGALGQPHRPSPPCRDRWLRDVGGRQARGDRGDIGQPAERRRDAGDAEHQPGDRRGRVHRDPAVVGAHLKWPGISGPPDRSKISYEVNHGTSKNSGFRQSRGRAVGGGSGLFDAASRPNHGGWPHGTAPLGRGLARAGSADTGHRGRPTTSHRAVAGAVESLRRSALHPGTGARPAKKIVALSTRRAVSTQTLDTVRGELSVRRVHALLSWPRSRYYAVPPPIAVVDDTVAREVRRIYRNSRGSCGARMLSHGLRRAGLNMGRERAATVMRLMNLTAKKKRFKHYSRNTKPAPAENLLNRQFDPGRPNQAWAGDITYIPTRQGWLYLAIVVDLFSRRIIGWATSQIADTRLALEASELAFATRKPDAGLIVHSDQGCQYTSDLYVAHVRGHGALQSMSRKGNCWD